MSLVYLTKRIEFCSAHRYYREEWDRVKNHEVFGSCANAPGHGHNYLLDVTLGGEVDPVNGMVVNLTDLKLVLQEVLEAFDHKHLNLDTPYFKDKIPTMENLAQVLWQLLDRERTIGTLHKLQLAEDEDLQVVLTAAHGPDRASIARRYAARTEAPGTSAWTGRDGQGSDCDLWISLEGRIDSTTGMVVDLQQLDRVMKEHVVPSLPRTVLGLRRAHRGGTGEELSRAVWELLVPHLQEARLEQVKLIDSRDLVYEYAG